MNGNILAAIIILVIIVVLLYLYKDDIWKESEHIVENRRVNHKSRHEESSMLDNLTRQTMGVLGAAGIRGQIRERSPEEIAAAASQAYAKEGLETTIAATSSVNGEQHLGASDDFNGGVSYSDVITAQGVPKDAIKNHREWVAGRLGNDGLRVGRSWNHDTFESDVGANPWMGLNRPVAVTVGNPDQVTDFPTTAYASSRRVKY